MQLGMIGLGRMGANMVRRLMRGGHTCVVYDRNADAVKGLASEGATGPPSLARFRAEARAAARDLADGAGRGRRREHRRAACRCSNAATASSTAATRTTSTTSAAPESCAAKGIDYVDVGTSGGVWGLERGYCMMIGGPDATVKRLDPIFDTLAPGIGDVAAHARAASKTSGTAERGYLHCGPNGAGHFVKMVHNGIEYGMMAAYAEGLGMLQLGQRRQAHASDRRRDDAAARSRTLSVRFRSAARSPKSGAAAASSLRGCSISRRRRFVQIRSSRSSPAASRIRARAAGRSKPAIDEAVPAPVLTTALYARFSSRGEAEFQNKVLSAMRFGFGGHLETPHDGSKG